jgi:hypothetical protein
VIARGSRANDPIMARKKKSDLFSETMKARRKGNIFTVLEEIMFCSKIYIQK